MRLRFSPASPYVRKVMVLAHEGGLADAMDLVTTDVWGDEGAYRAVNPLGKVPALELADGTVLFDSPVICEYLDVNHCKGQFLPVQGDARWAALRLQALADGILDASVLQLLEGRRDEAQRSTAWIARQQAAVDAALDSLEQEAAALDGLLTVGVIAAACALGYRDFRFPEIDWRGAHPRLTAWYGRFSERPSMQATIPRNL